MNRYNAKNGRVQRVQDTPWQKVPVPQPSRECAKKQSRDMGDFWVLAVFAGNSWYKLVLKGICSGSNVSYKE